jgi:hypothetical protein
LYYKERYKRHGEKSHEEIELKQAKRAGLLFDKALVCQSSRRLQQSLDGPQNQIGKYAMKIGNSATGFGIFYSTKKEKQAVKSGTCPKQRK